MFGIPIVELAIGLIFVYLLLALICTTVNETIAGITGRRAAVLEKGILALVGGDESFKDEIYNHPLVASLKDPSSKIKPSYIPSSKFALAVMHIVKNSAKNAEGQDAFRSGLKAAETKPYARSLSTVLGETAAPGEREKSDQQKIEAWFNDGMDRVSGWYKRKTTLWIYILAAIVAITLNADTIRISRTLWNNQAVRTAVVEQAKARTQAEQPSEPIPMVEYTNPNEPNSGTPVRPSAGSALTLGETNLLGRLTGWSGTIEEWRNLGQPLTLYLSLIFRSCLGLFLTIVAVSQGAPFWFDTLNRFMNIRSAGRAPDEPRDKSTSSKGGTSNAQ
jgi:hypothetical protein